MSSSPIAQGVIGFAKRHGRFHLPWKQNPTPYRVWVSEIMLQQTQVQTVIDYFNRFMTHFEDIQTLADADIEEVLALWAGLGYYRRAHLLHQCAKTIVREHQGRFPQTVDTLMTLPGIGRTTAGAILSQALGIRAPILDGNVKRVLMRAHNIQGYPDSPANLKTLWTLSEAITPYEDLNFYTQGIMDLGANLCTKKNPDCHICPIQAHCLSYKLKTQHLIPSPKPKKKKPLKRCYFAVIYNYKQKILLLRRPNKGIWGGLWCLPAMHPSSKFKTKDSHAFHQHTHTVGLGEQRRHQFTHFNLEYKPVKMRFVQPFKIKDRATRWVSLEQALALGVPVPIKKILEEELSCLE